MKISLLHLFIILFGSLLLTYSLGTFMREGFTDSDKKLVIDMSKLSAISQQALQKFFADQKASNPSSFSSNVMTSSNNTVTIDSTLLSPVEYIALSKFFSGQTAIDPSFASALSTPSGSAAGAGASLGSASLGSASLALGSASDKKLIIDTTKLSTTAQQALNKFFSDQSSANPSYFPSNIVSTSNNMVTIDSTLLNPSAYIALSKFFSGQVALDPSFTSALSSPSGSAPGAGASLALGSAPAPSFNSSSSAYTYSTSSSPLTTGQSITGKLTQMFDNVKNSLEGAVTDNNTNVYNMSQQRYDSYQGPAGDTVLTSPPPPQTVGLPSFSTPSSYPFPSPPPLQFNPNKNSLGIPYSQIPQGQTDLYILKSEVIPPVCPACPNVTACASKDPPPPCPPCARCPEPAFECKKVPNYRGGDNSYLPLPVLADFSQFGM